MKVRLTKTSMAKLPPCEGDKEHLVWDAELPGFGLRVSPKGKRTFFVQWRSPTGQGKRRLGDASIVDPDAARKEAKAILAKVQLGGDPQRDRRVERAKVAITFAPTVARYLSDHAEKALRPSTLSDVRRYLSVHFAPLNPLPLHEVTRAVVAARLAEIIKASGPTAANRGRAHLQAFFAWCMGEGLCDLNPVVGTNRATERGARARVLTNDELADVWHAANPNTDFGRIVRLLILTGSRREEVAGMRWPELTLVPAEKAAWTLPGSRAKNGREHLVPLSPAALDVIGAVIRRNDRDFLFGERTGPFAGFSKAKAALVGRITRARGEKLPRPAWTLHDLRRTAATGMAGLGVQPHVVEAALNHVSGSKSGVRGVYNRQDYAAEKRDALNLWADFIVKFTETTGDRAGAEAA